MRLAQRLLMFLIPLTLVLADTLPAIAQSATLTARDANTQINIRTQPSTQSAAPHYGLPGDRVEILDQTRGTDGYTWYYIRFAGSGAEGWVRGDYVQITHTTSGSSGSSYGLQEFGSVAGVGTVSVIRGTYHDVGAVREFEAIVNGQQEHWWANCQIEAIGTGSWSAPLNEGTRNIRTFVCRDR